MNKQEIEEYKKTAKIGDRLVYKETKQIQYVRAVEERGIVTSLKKDWPDHQWLLEWSRLVNYTIIHKEK
jgi:hypothetical protein